MSRQFANVILLILLHNDDIMLTLHRLCRLCKNHLHIVAYGFGSIVVEASSSTSSRGGYRIKNH